MERATRHLLESKRASERTRALRDVAVHSVSSPISTEPVVHERHFHRRGIHHSRRKLLHVSNGAELVDAFAASAGAPALACSRSLTATRHKQAPRKHTTYTEPRTLDLRSALRVPVGIHLHRPLNVDARASTASSSLIHHSSRLEGWAAPHSDPEAELNG